LPVSDRLKQAITSSGLTHYAIGKKAGVDAGVISRFMAGERDIRLETVDWLATALELVLMPRPGGRRVADRDE
jgi:transcriptional regulator with XRE-family HTH domain